MHGNAAVLPGQPDHLAGARHVGGPQLLVRVDEVHQRARMVDDVDVAGEVAEPRVGKSEPGWARSPGSGTTRPSGGAGSS